MQVNISRCCCDSSTTITVEWWCFGSGGRHFFVTGVLYACHIAAATPVMLFHGVMTLLTLIIHFLCIYSHILAILFSDCSCQCSNHIAGFNFCSLLVAADFFICYFQIILKFITCTMRVCALSLMAAMPFKSTTVLRWLCPWIQQWRRP